MKKLIALLLSVLLALTSMAPAYAAKPYLENQNFSIEASIDELADGITFAIIQEADGSLTVQKIEQSDIALQANQRVAGTFHCGLTYHKNASTAHIHWTATSSQITGVRARVYCKPTYVIGGDYGNYFFYLQRLQVEGCLFHFRYFKFAIVTVERSGFPVSLSA